MRKTVVSIAAFRDGKFLMGLRGDSGKWNLPGGHMEEKDGDPLALGAFHAAERELLEETGLKAQHLEMLGFCDVRENLRVYSFICEVEGQADASADPDEEMVAFKWLDPKKLPKSVMENLYNRKDVTLQFLGIQDRELDLIWDEDAPSSRELERKLQKGQLDYSTPEFQSWFQGSKVVDHRGAPLRVFHGTSKDADFSSFKTGKRGAWFTSNPEEAGEYAMQNDSMGSKWDPKNPGKTVRTNTASRIIPVHLALKNPYKMTAADLQAHQGAENYVRHQGQHFDQLRAAGHDGVDFGNGIFVAFHPNQVKSVFNTAPTDSSNHLQKASLEEIMARVQATSAHIRALADQGPMSHVFTHPQGGHVMVSRDPSKPSAFRATRIDATGTPIGHIEAPDIHGAIKAAHQYGADVFSSQPFKKSEPFETEAQEWLVKATRPDSFKSIARAVTPEGRRFVDHESQKTAHPPEHNPVVEHYENEILRSGKVHLPKKGNSSEGVTRKVIYATHFNPQGDMLKPTPHGMDAKFMVKPYHEGIVGRIKSWQKFPIQGWAEMANQALYHAGGIGHLHQKVHVSEHNMGAGHEKEPALVVHMEPGMDPMYLSVRAHNPHPQLSHDAMKVGLMDFLTNNLDRHGGNLMLGDPKHYEPEDGRVPAAYTHRLLAIDHSRSFQYVNNHTHKWDSQALVKKKRDMSDSLRPYLLSHSTSSVGHLMTLIHGRHIARDHAHDRRQDFLEQHAKPAFDWWEQAGPKVRTAFEQQVAHIKDPAAKAHIIRNFNARADFLDERARLGIENYGQDWYDDPVAQYHPDQKTDEEREHEDHLRAVAEYEAEQAKAKEG
jgi:8-oxo-dGTP pyrophosphatase MutT (NUDIX family)